jgi:phosphatidylglycerol:prolipoprotein diacylglycerol transferase
VGFLVGFAFAVFSSPARGTRLRAAALFGLSGVAGLLGARMFWALGAVDGPLRSGRSWADVFDPSTPGLWSFGALMVGGAAAYEVAGRMGGDSRGTLLDLVVPGALTTLLFARLGCLAAGCDFGAPTDLPWGLRYPAHWPAWEAHRAADLIVAGAGQSLPTHPLPLYLAGVSAAAIGAGVLASQGRGVRPGRRALVAGYVYLAGRFGVEFLRAPSTAPSIFGEWLNLNHCFTFAVVAVLVSISRRRVHGE